MQMKVARVRKKAEIKRENQVESYSVKSMIKILVYVLLIFGLFYFITVMLVNNKKENSNNPVSVIDSSKIILSQLLNRSEDEYFVIATKASLYESSYIDTNYINLYNDYINNYKQNEESLMFYYVDLDSALNRNYISDNLNITDNLANLKINDEVLFKIKDGSIEKYYVGKDKILDKLSRL